MLKVYEYISNIIQIFYRLSHYPSSEWNVPRNTHINLKFNTSKVSVITVIACRISDWTIELERRRERERKRVAAGKLVARMVDNMSLGSSTFDVLESTPDVVEFSFDPRGLQTLLLFFHITFRFVPFLGASSVDKQKESFGKRRVKCPTASQNADKRNMPKVCKGLQGEW